MKIKASKMIIKVRNIHQKNKVHVNNYIRKPKVEMPSIGKHNITNKHSFLNTNQENTNTSK